MFLYGIMKSILQYIRKFKVKIKFKLLCKSCDIDRSVVIYGETIINNSSGIKKNLKIEKDSHIRGKLLTYPIGGRIHIGKRCYIGDLSRIWAMGSITIGNDVLIAHNVNIIDNNSHSTDYKVRKDELKYITTTGHPKTNIFSVTIKNITIEDNAWIGLNSIILKGVKIGTGAIVSAGSVVTKDVPPFTMVAGNPAKIIREL